MSEVSSKKSILQSHEEEDHKIATKYANIYDVYLLGITIVIGGQVFSWNVSLAAGYWEAFFGMMTTGFLYLSLILCIAEMTSALPFSGGSYGFVRVCLGPFFGYLVGCCETLQNIAYVASAVIPLAEMISTVFHTSANYEPIYWTFFFITSIAINIIGGNVFWKFSRYIGIISLLIILLYIVAAAQFSDFSKWSGSYVKNYDMNLTNFLTNLPICAWYYIGVESLPLSCVDCNEPSKEIPYAMIACMLTLFCTAIGVFFTTTSQYPGIDELSGAMLPLNYGFQRAFGLTDDQVTWLALPATYATGFGFMFIYGRQMCSMARSGLFPSIFRLRTKETRSPYIALLIGSIFAAIGMITVYYTDVTYLNEIFYLCILCSNYIYSSVFLCYIIFKFRYDSMQRHYSNNKVVGVVAAVYGIGYCILSTISVLGYQATSSKQLPLTIFGSYMGLLLIYYYFFGYATQKLSEEEQKVMFRAYVINANAIKRKTKGRTASVMSSHAGSTHGGSTRSDSVNSDDGNHAPAAKKNPFATKARFNIKQEMVIREAELRRSSIASIPEDLLMYEENEKVDEESTLRRVEATNLADREDQKSEQDQVETLTKENAHSPCEPTTNTHPAVDKTHHILPVQTVRPLFSHRVLPFESMSNSGRRDEEDHNNYSSKFLTHQTFTKSFSEKVKEIIHDIKLVPFMNDAEREDYETMVLADVCGKLDKGDISSQTVMITPNLELIDDQENQLIY